MMPPHKANEQPWPSEHWDTEYVLYGIFLLKFKLHENVCICKFYVMWLSTANLPLKPLSELLLTQISDAIWRHWDIMSYGNGWSLEKQTTTLKHVLN